MHVTIVWKQQFDTQIGVVQVNEFLKTKHIHILSTQAKKQTTSFPEAFMMPPSGINNYPPDFSECYVPLNCVQVKSCLYTLSHLVSFLWGSSILMFEVVMCSFLFLYSIMNMAITLFILLFIKGWVASSFRFIWMILQSAFLYTSGEHIRKNLCCAYTKNGIATSQGIHVFRFKTHWRTDFQDGCINLHFYQEYIAVLIVLHSC